MEDNSSASSDSDNALLSPDSHARIGCTVSTQTPEMPRHEINIPDANKNPPQTLGADLNSSIVVYKLDTLKPMSELEQQARSLSIPDVVVEYIKDSYSRQDDMGSTNPAFEPQELIVVRTPSAISLRDDGKLETGMVLSPMDKSNPLYSSISRNGGQSMLLSVMDKSLTASNISLCPRSVPPSPTFGYRPLESETSAVYTIISPVRYKGSEKEIESRLLAQIQAQMDKEKATARKFEFCPAPVEVERKRHRLQLATDICSTMFLIPGLIIAMVTPISLIPLFILPLKYYIPLIAIFILSGMTATLSLTVSGFLGNVVWHYDDQKQKMRPRLHCGTGPLRHFWGNGFYPKFNDHPLPEKMVV